MPTAHIGSMRIGAGQPLLVIAGPCVMESEAATLDLAGRIRELLAGLPVQWVFKASFDKANRTSGQAFRGVGLDQGMQILARVKEEVHVPVTTDIHESHQAAPVGSVCDLIQIPAFLARQTDLLLAAAATGRALHVKKGQFMAPSDMRYVVEKVHQAGNPNLLLCERGTFFGYGQLVNDLRGLIQMREFDVPVVFDATHSVQQPGGLGGATGGNRQYVAPLARAAAAVGIDGLFFETHPHPDRSPSDGPNMVPLQQAAALVHEVLAVRSAMQTATGWR